MDMTTAQWIFEAHALQARDRIQADTVLATVKASVRILRNLMVSVLGLRLRATKEGEEADEFKFVPLSVLLADPARLKDLMSAEEAEAAVETATEDEAFDAFSKQLARGEVGDLEPILSSDPTPGKVSVEEYQAMLKSMGIKIVGGK